MLSKKEKIMEIKKNDKIMSTPKSNKLSISFKEMPKDEIMCEASYSSLIKALYCTLIKKVGVMQKSIIT